jgi:hypothetical protein
MRHMPIPPAALCTLVAGLVLPWAAQSAEQAPSCEQIVAACKDAGFVKGDYRLV